MINFSNYQTTPAIPEASSMIETFRAIGYSIETAVADIIDNSISANAKSIWINFDWKGSETWLAIKDDGAGMNNDELINAMRPGSKHPFDKRKDNDLGRFGLGLKTASFSQCRKLTVISKKQDEGIFYWTWDLDYVNMTGKWELIKYLPNPEFENELNVLSSGTLVVWNDIDRLCNYTPESDTKVPAKFLQTMELVKKHLAMVFHRYIENRKIKIWFQNRELTAWNPFMPDEPATQSFPEEPLFNGNVTVKGFILPHKSKLSDDKFRQGEGTKGWNGHQGFYIYRNERLLVAGDWLGLFRKEEHYKLSRIAIDLPNNLDAEWQIDIKKSVARPPVLLKDHLKAYAVKLRAQAVEVYRHRGKTVRQLPGQTYVPFWTEHKRGDNWLHVINREHPVIEKIKQTAETNPDRAIELLLRFVEETIPSKSIYIKEAEGQDSQQVPFGGTSQEPVVTLMNQIYSSLINQGRTPEIAKAIISNFEPFNNFPHMIEHLY
jgi:hypothetical protein